MQSIDATIIHLIQSTASSALEKIIRPKMYMKEGQTEVSLTVDEFNELRVALATLSSHEGFAKINSYIEAKYLEPRKEKLRILSMLQ